MRDWPCKLLVAVIGYIYAFTALTDGGSYTKRSLMAVGIVDEWGIGMLIAASATLVALILGLEEVIWISTVMQGSMWLMLTGAFIVSDVFVPGAMMAPTFTLFSLYVAFAEIAYIRKPAHEPAPPKSFEPSAL